jgi:hypothetical protein
MHVAIESILPPTYAYVYELKKSQPQSHKTNTCLSSKSKPMLSPASTSLESTASWPDSSFSLLKKSNITAPLTRIGLLWKKTCQQKSFGQSTNLSTLSLKNAADVRIMRTSMNATSISMTSTQTSSCPALTSTSHQTSTNPLRRLHLGTIMIPCQTRIKKGNKRAMEKMRVAARERTTSLSTTTKFPSSKSWRNMGEDTSRQVRRQAREVERHFHVPLLAYLKVLLEGRVQVCKDPCSRRKSPK